MQVAIDGLAVVVNPQNDFVQCLTVAELRRMWEPGSQVTNWSQVRAASPNQPVRLYGPGHELGHVRLLHPRGHG
jgi:phosphate transport system substrate-binding protein